MHDGAHFRQGFCGWVKSFRGLRLLGRACGGAWSFGREAPCTQNLNRACLVSPKIVWPLFLTNLELKLMTDLVVG